jgi:hypothetical protein
MAVLVAAGWAHASEDSLFTVDPVWLSAESRSSISVEVADVDMDGDLDVIFSSSYSPSQLYRNDDGALTTSPVWSSSSSQGGHRIAVGDVDRDGYPDLVCGSVYERLCLFLNDGGSFPENADWTIDIGINVFDVALGDIDGDGWPDLAVALGDYMGESYPRDRVYLNLGGVFDTEPAWHSSKRGHTMSVVLGDIDNDGDLDLLTACQHWDHGNYMYLNQQGVLDSVPAWQALYQDYSTSLALGDIDGDGYLDLVCGSDYPGANSFYINRGGYFVGAPDWQTEELYATLGISLGDVDCDGDLDLACANALRWDQGPNTVYFNDGGSMDLSPGWESRPDNPSSGVALADIDGDGDLDLIFANSGTNTMYLNRHGAFDETPSWQSVPQKPTATITLEDVDLDGYRDLVCGNAGQHDAIYFGLGGGIETEPSWTSAAEHQTQSMLLVDLDDNGYRDLVCGNFREVNTIHFNETGVPPTEASWSSLLTEWTNDMALHDFNGDGYLDMVCGNKNQENTLFWGYPAGFHPYDSWASSEDNDTRSIALGDIDGDGAQDLACGNWLQSNCVYMGGGSTFSSSPGWSSAPVNATTAVELEDIDGDGDPDLVCANWGDFNAIYLNNAGSLTASPEWVSALANATYGLAVGDVDGDGDLDLVFGNDGEPNALHVNDGGDFSPVPTWSSGPANATRCVAIGDVDADGDRDIICGNHSCSNCIYENTTNPPVRCDLLAPDHHLPNNAAFISSVRAEVTGTNLYSIDLTLFDIESDSVWIAADYGFRGESVWHPGVFAGYSGPAGPLASAPEGVPHQLIWDASGMPFDDRDVTLRLRTISMPTGGGPVQRIPVYLLDAGRVEVRRAEIAPSPEELVFPAVTVGDTVTARLFLGNSGTEILHVSGISLPSPEMRILPVSEFQVLPGESAETVILLEPRELTEVAGGVVVTSNDPISPAREIAVTADIHRLSVQTRLLSPVEEAPLGEALTVVVTPGPGVNVERGFLYCRPGTQAEFADSIRLSRFGDDLIAIIPGVVVTEAGLDYYVSVENSGVVATDPPGAPFDSVFHQAVEPPAFISSQPNAPEGATFREGRDIQIQIFLEPGTELISGQVHYRPGGGSEYGSVPLQTGELVHYAVIPDSAVTARGVEYWVEVESLTRILTDPQQSPSDRPRCIRITVENLEEGRQRAGGKYRMLSVPLEMEGTISGSLTDDLGGLDVTRWRMFTYLPESGAYLEIPNDSIFSFETGRGTWLIASVAYSLDTGPVEGLSTPADRPFEIDLQPGWNMIGNPFAFPVDWGHAMVNRMQIAMEGTQVSTPVGWDDGYQYDCEMLMPFEGYWVKNLTDSVVLLGIQPVEAADAVQALGSEHAVRAPDGRRAWRVRIAASCTGAEGCAAAAGVATGAREGWDVEDRARPPQSPRPEMAVYFPHHSWPQQPGIYSRDIRNQVAWAGGGASGASSAGHAWRFDVTKGLSGKPSDQVKLTFDIAEVPADLSVCLADLELGKLTDLRAQGRYSFCLGRRGLVCEDSDARFQLLVGSDEFVRTRGRGMPGLPSATVLRANRPNPFTDATVLRYEISGKTRASIKIYDATGALVTVLWDGDCEPGRHEVVWDGLNRAGREVAPGLYVARLETPSRIVSTRKLLLIR